MAELELGKAARLVYNWLHGTLPDDIEVVYASRGDGIAGVHYLPTARGLHAVAMRKLLLDNWKYYVGFSAGLRTLVVVPGERQSV